MFFKMEVTKAAIWVVIGSRRISRAHTVMCIIKKIFFSMYHHSEESETYEASLVTKLNYSVIHYRQVDKLSSFYVMFLTKKVEKQFLNRKNFISWPCSGNMYMRMLYSKMGGVIDRGFGVGIIADKIRSFVVYLQALLNRTVFYRETYPWLFILYIWC